jgi:hypothetical protein
MGRINGLEIKRKASLDNIYKRDKYDMLEIHSRNVFNSEKVLETKQDFGLFLDIVGSNDRDINRLFINYHLINPNSEKANVVKNKVNGIYEELKDGIEKLENATDKDLGLKFTIRAEDDKLAVVQSYNKYELDKHYISKESEIYNSLSQFKTDREDIGKIIQGKLDKEYNYIRELTDGGEENTEYRVKETYIPKINKTVFIIDRKNIDFNEDKEKEEYWETFDMYTDIDALGSLSMMKEKNLFKDKKLELNKNLDEKDCEKIVNVLENPKIKTLLKNKEYFTFDFTSDGKEKPVGLNEKGMEKFGNRKSTIGLFASFLVLNSFKDNYLEDKEKNGEYSIKEKALDRNNILVKRALNVVSEFDKNNKDIEEFVKIPKNNLVNISAMSLAEIEMYERSQKLSPELRQELSARKDYLEKFAVIDGLWNKDGERTDHIENLSEMELLIDLYDGNTSPEQRRLLEMKLVEFSKKHKEEQEEMQKEIDKILGVSKENTLLLASTGMMIGVMQTSAGNGNRIENELENSSKKYINVLSMEDYNKELESKEQEKERKKEEKINNQKLRLLLSVREAKRKEKAEREKELGNLEDDEKSDINDEKKNPERVKIKKLGEKGKKIGMFIANKGFISKDKNFDENNKGIKEHSEEFLKINKAMAIANQNRIDYNMAKTKASVMNITPSGDVFIEMQLLKNSPERIYNDGMAVLTMEKTEPINLVDRLAKENKNSEKGEKNNIEKRLGDKIVEKDLKDIPSGEINEKMETTFNELQTNIIEKDLHEKETYKAIENITQEKEVTVEKENIIEIDMRTNEIEKKTDEVQKETVKVKEQVKKDEKKVEKKEEKQRDTSGRVYEVAYDDDKKDKGKDDFEM